MRPDWSRAMVDKSTDHGNDIMVAQFLLLFLARAMFIEKLRRKWMLQTAYVIVKKQANNKFPLSVLLAAIRPAVRGSN